MRKFGNVVIRRLGCALPDNDVGVLESVICFEIMEAFHTIKEQYQQIFLISHESEIKEMFERMVDIQYPLTKQA